jgi:iron complex transport system substrate-binding protein
MSESGIAHLFARAVGQALMDRFFCLRMDRAAELLLDSDSTLADIGAQVGMPDASYFCRRFHKHFGLTPMRYRATLGSSGQYPITGDDRHAEPRAM